jgi:hypothetical protein
VQDSSNAFASHHCACFTHDPQKPHLQVVLKQIVCYLKGTADTGIIFTTVDEASVDCYVDADFAGGFNKEGDTKIWQLHAHAPGTLYLPMGYLSVGDLSFRLKLPSA